MKSEAATKEVWMSLWMKYGVSSSYLIWAPKEVSRRPATGNLEESQEVYEEEEKQEKQERSEQPKEEKSKSQKNKSMAEKNKGKT